MSLACLLILSSCAGVMNDQEGNPLKVVTIGKQQWMAENLNVSHYRNGDTITRARSQEDWVRLGAEGKPAWCLETTLQENTNKSGRLYNWYAVIDPRGLAPKGWHIPADEEWTQLVRYLGGDVLAAMKMRTSLSSSAVDEAGANGFSGLPRGGCSPSGVFFGNGSNGYWWSATDAGAETAWGLQLNYLHCIVNQVSNLKGYGFSVRCIKD